MAKVELKQPIIDEISANVKDADSVILVNYLGINVAGDTALRKELREAGVLYKVYKNTMMNRAFKGTDLEPLCAHLEEDYGLVSETRSKYGRALALMEQAAAEEEP